MIKGNKKKQKNDLGTSVKKNNIENNDTPQNGITILTDSKEGSADLAKTHNIIHDVGMTMVLEKHNSIYGSQKRLEISKCMQEKKIWANLFASNQLVARGMGLNFFAPTIKIELKLWTKIKKRTE